MHHLVVVKWCVFSPLYQGGFPETVEENWLGTGNEEGACPRLNACIPSLPGTGARWLDINDHHALPKGIVSEYNSFMGGIVHTA
jgi:hypothetical protein